MLLLFLTVIFWSAGYVGQKLCCICCFDMSTFNKTYKPELVTTRHSYSYRYNLSYLILLHLQSCDSYNLHDLYAIFYTDIWL